MRRRFLDGMDMLGPAIPEDLRSCARSITRTIPSVPIDLADVLSSTLTSIPSERLSLDVWESLRRGLGYVGYLHPSYVCRQKICRPLNLGESLGHDYELTAARWQVRLAINQCDWSQIRSAHSNLSAQFQGQDTNEFRALTELLKATARNFDSSGLSILVGPAPETRDRGPASSRHTLHTLATIKALRPLTVTAGHNPQHFNSVVSYYDKAHYTRLLTLDRNNDRSAPFASLDEVVVQPRIRLRTLRSGTLQRQLTDLNSLCVAGTWSIGVRAMADLLVRESSRVVASGFDLYLNPQRYSTLRSDTSAEHSIKQEWRANSGLSFRECRNAVAIDLITQRRLWTLLTGMKGAAADPGLAQVLALSDDDYMRLMQKQVRLVSSQ